MRKFQIGATFLFFYLWISSVYAQDFFADFFAPSNQLPTWSLRATGESAHPVSQQKVSLSAPIHKTATDPASLTWKWNQLNLEDRQVLNNGEILPNKLSSGEYGMTYRHSESESEFWGFSASAGSAGDETFNSKVKTVVNANFFYSSSQDPTSRWLWLVNYSNNRSFLNEIPILGVAYIYRPSADFMGLFGFPFVFIRMKLDEDWSTSLFLGPFVYKAEFNRTIAGPIKFFVSGEQTLQSYYRANRSTDDHRIFYSEARALTGLRGPLSQLLFLEAYTGFTYNRSALEEKSYLDSYKDAVSLENTWLFGAQISARF